MIKPLLSLLIGLLAIFTSCSPADETTPGDTDPKLAEFYLKYNYKFVSRLEFMKEDKNNYTEATILNLTERNASINIIARTFYAAEGIFVGQAKSASVDLYDTKNSSVAITNAFINSKYYPNPYTSKAEWDFDTRSRLFVMKSNPSDAFFPNYFGGSLVGYYNASTGKDLFSFKKYPYGYGGYARNVGEKVMYVDMYRSKIFYEEKADSSWRELTFSPSVYGNSFDFETAGSDYGVVAVTKPNSLLVFALNGLSLTPRVELATGSNVAFAGWDGAYTVSIVKNGALPNKPCIVIRRNKSIDVFRYDIVANTLELVYANLALPPVMHFTNYATFGDCDKNVTYAFSGKQCMMQMGIYLYTLSNGEFVPFNSGLPPESKTTVTAFDSGSNCIYLGLSVTTPSGKKVGDVVKMMD